MVRAAPPVPADAIMAPFGREGVLLIRANWLLILANGSVDVSEDNPQPILPKVRHLAACIMSVNRFLDLVVNNSLSPSGLFNALYMKRSEHKVSRPPRVMR
jgi:hypothetical protein